MNNYRTLCTSQTPSGRSYRPQATEIVRGVYMSDLHTAYDVQTLRSLRITHIVSVLPGALDLPQGIIPPSHTLQIPVEDMPFVEIFAYLDPAVRWIERALRSQHDARILVHCFKGASRSATVICAYLMKARRMGVDNALEYIKSRRVIAEPNFGFVMQLREYERTL